MSIKPQPTHKPSPKFAAKQNGAPKPAKVVKGPKSASQIKTKTVSRSAVGKNAVKPAEFPFNS